VLRKYEVFIKVSFAENNLVYRHSQV
jgi:hypothetical protein